MGYDRASISRQTRFNGLNSDIGGYSIAQHCVLGADALMEEQGDTYLAHIFFYMMLMKLSAATLLGHWRNALVLFSPNK